MYPFSGTMPGVLHSLTVDDDKVEANYLDLSSTTIRTADATFQPDLFVRSLAQADGVVLLYDVTSPESFENITSQAYMYACMCSQYMSGSPRPVDCQYILVGTKTDLLRRHRGAKVDTELAQEWAQSQGMHHIDISSFAPGEPEAAARKLVKSIQRAERRAAKEAAGEEANKRIVKPTMRSKMKLAFGRKKSDA